MSDTLLLGTRKGLIQFQRSSSGWKAGRVSHLGHPVTYAVRDPRDGRIWAALDHGHWGNKLHVSDDDGATWSDDLCPAYPDDAEIEPGKPAKLDLVWVVQPGPADQPGRIYLGTNPGGLFKSDDGGQTFSLVRGLWDHPTRTPKTWFGGGRDTPGIHSIWVDPRDSRRVFVGISCAGVYETTDDGATWAPRNKGLKAEFLPDPAAEVGQDPHFVMGCRNHPDTLWQQNHCGIWRSADTGATWTEVSDPDGPAGFGFPVWVHPDKPDSAWFVPGLADSQRVAVGGALCVSRTDDGGRTWQHARDGLPQQTAFDVVYRHALDGSGDRMAFGSTTGNAYVSEDGGRSWDTLGNNLPPVYSVRFG